MRGAAGSGGRGRPGAGTQGCMPTQAAYAADSCSNNTASAEASLSKTTETVCLQEREEELMLEALGVKAPARKAAGPARLNQQDMQQLTQQAEGENDPGPDRIKGLGYDPTSVQGQIAHAEVLPGIAAQAPRQQQQGAAGRDRTEGLHRTEQKAIRKAEKKAAKAAKKEAKHARKEGRGG